ncbi:uncharacterized protein FOMMEDRAFT_30986 [Fomitiporia mediterranea MF3/22]|uniref:uncharacterized protein n=1 Tax=Fomitiporia mediterranea (strain MF3/22) TaxID=694068 RepID=UPI00044084F1|nr:uncharacterized protein FOMMEDRAFT_30986 [Fomitiporia mediterranea MF3/22]EJC99679.1 hypothetical protein FOMMEDRAFT_30986 [Fomitiporia mediterranea MF3/22]
MIIARFKSIAMTPRPRILRRIQKKKGKRQTTWLIPDFGIIRFVDRRRGFASDRPDRPVWFQAQSRLVGIAEIKCSPVDNTPFMVLAAVDEAYVALVRQVKLFFKANKDVDSIIGIPIAGDWWSYKPFTRDNLPAISRRKRDADSYIPSSDSSSIQQQSQSNSISGDDSNEESSVESNDDSSDECSSRDSDSNSDTDGDSVEDSVDELNYDNDDTNSDGNDNSDVNSDNGSHEESGVNTDDDTAETTSSKDELDIISQDEGPISKEYLANRPQRDVRGGIQTFYRLRTPESDVAITTLFEAIRDLPCCKDLDEQSF